MRNLTFLMFVLFFAAFLSAQVKAQQSDAATYFAKFITAQKYLRGDGLPKDTAHAFRLMKDCAANGKMPDAMADLGIFYKYGFGTPKNLNQAFYWFSQGTDKDNPSAMFQLGVMYKNGETVQQDFGKAYGYFKASAEKGLPNGMYGAGYCAYKGLGTTQDYTEAANWFNQGMEQGNAACLFMMGICKRNGFGVERNEQEARELLEKAEKGKIAVAKDELARQFPEIDGIKPKKKNGEKTGSNSSQQQKFRKLIRNQNNIPLDGIWRGTRYLFDWSGQYILHQADLLVKLKQTGNHISGEWFEGGVFVVNFKGTIIGDQIVFDNTSFKGNNRYGQPVPMEFRCGRFEAINADVNYLAGNIESYSPKTKEPGYPCYVVVSKLPADSTISDTLQLKNLRMSTFVDSTNINTPNLKISRKDYLTDSSAQSNSTVSIGKLQNEVLDYFKKKDVTLAVFPNPFKHDINLSYQVSEEGDANLYVYDITGNLVLQKSLGHQYKGSHLEKLQLNSTPGQYVLRLVIGNDAYSKIVIKQ